MEIPMDPIHLLREDHKLSGKTGHGTFLLTIIIHILENGI